MKILEKIALFIFSIIILALSIISCLVISKIIDLKIIYDYLSEAINQDDFVKVALVVISILVLLAIKALFFPTRAKKKNEIKTGVLLENKDGRLLISRDTIENMVESIARSFDDAIDVQTKVNLDENNIITVYIALLVKEDTVIKQLSTNIQTKIKETIKNNTDLEVDKVNINIRNINSNKPEVGRLPEKKIKRLNEAKQEKTTIEEVKNEEQNNDESSENNVYDNQIEIQ